MRRAFPDVNAHLEDIFGAKDRVAVRLIFRGTHAGDFRAFPARAAASNASVTSSTASATASSPRNGSARTQPP